MFNEGVVEYYLEEDAVDELRHYFETRIAERQAAEEVPNTVAVRLTLMLVTAAITALPIVWLASYALILFQPLPVIAVGTGLFLIGSIVLYFKILEIVGRIILKHRIRQLRRWAS